MSKLIVLITFFISITVNGFERFVVPTQEVNEALIAIGQQRELSDKVKIKVDLSTDSSISEVYLNNGERFSRYEGTTLKPIQLNKLDSIYMKNGSLFTPDTIIQDLINSGKLPPGFGSSSFSAVSGTDSGGS